MYCEKTIVNPCFDVYYITACWIKLNEEDYNRPRVKVI